MRKNNRKQYLIDKKFQVTLILYFTSIALIASIIIYFLANLAYVNLLDELIINGASDIALNTVKGSHSRFDSTFIILIISLTVLFICFSLILSNKIAGPIYRLRKHLNECKDSKKLNKVYFREGDFFKSLETDFNNFVDASEKDTN